MRRKTTPFREPDANLRKADEAAESVLAWCVKALNLKAPPVCIPVDVWIERPLEMRLEVTDLSHLPEGTEGSADTQNFIIQIEQTIADDESRFRFACAHELGHIVLHRKAKKVFHEYTHIGRIYLDLYERQADRFARSFLVPPASSLAWLLQLADRQGTDRVRFMDILMHASQLSLELWTGLVLPEMERAFGLSRSILIERFAELRLRSSGMPFMPTAVARTLCPELTLDGSTPQVRPSKASPSSAVQENV